jgi:alpha-tubulin suppressor-like RCC1 family protein
MLLTTPVAYGAWHRPRPGRKQGECKIMANLSRGRAGWFLLAVLGVACTAGNSRAQGVDPDSYVVAWGRFGYDTRSREGRLAKVSCGWNNTAHLRADGRLFVQGDAAALPGGLSLIEVPPLPTGLAYTDVSLSRDNAMAIRSDGSAIGWGWSYLAAQTPSAPPLPPGLSYQRVSVSNTHGLLLRSDGAVVAFGDNSRGQCSVPSLPPGIAVLDVQVAYARSSILLGDGSVVLFGNNQYGQSTAPSLRPGVSYTSMAARRNDCTLLLRSDGQIEAFGDNTFGQCNVPPLGTGLRYEFLGAGDGFCVAVRSDNSIVTWGASTSSFGIGNPPLIPRGLRCIGLDVGQAHSVVLLSDGTVRSWGLNSGFAHYVPSRRLPSQAPTKRHVQVASGAFHSLVRFSDGTMEGFGHDASGQATVPVLPQGIFYVGCGGGGGHSLALRSDGLIVGFGNNQYGQLNVPPLPGGLTYTDMAVGYAHNVVLRSDGSAFAFGINNNGECNIPQLPPGLAYVKAAACELYSLLLRSDGTLAFCGSGSTLGSLASVPQPPIGTTFVDIAASRFFAVALASDNTLMAWGSLGGVYWVALPPLPAGVYYVEMKGSYDCVAFRRSDGQVVVMGTSSSYGNHVPPLEPGTSYVQVASGPGEFLAARASSTCTYIGITPGCAGSMPATPLIPRDTPRIGRTLEVNLRNLPINLAAMGMGFSQPNQPISLAQYGMPGCTLGIQLGGVALLSGQGNTAKFLLPIPDDPHLVGLHFYHQAMVFDPAVGNSLGAVMSDVAEGVIGYP